MLLAGDIGGTKTDLGIFSNEAGPHAPIVRGEVHSADYPSLQALAGEFLRKAPMPVDRACFAVAGPVIDGRAKTTNLPWAMDEDSLALNLRDIAEVWRRGSVIASWLLDLTATALVKDPKLSAFTGRVSDSGEGRWTIKAAIDEAVPVPVLSAALYQRFSSRGEADFQDKLLSAMRYEFGGHLEKVAGK